MFYAGPEWQLAPDATNVLSLLFEGVDLAASQGEGFEVQLVTVFA
jgi:hypothetical protein